MLNFHFAAIDYHHIDEESLLKIWFDINLAEIDIIFQNYLIFRSRKANEEKPMQRLSVRERCCDFAINDLSINPSIFELFHLVHASRPSEENIRTLSISRIS